MIAHHLSVLPHATRDGCVVAQEYVVPREKALAPAPAPAPAPAVGSDGASAQASRDRRRSLEPGEEGFEDDFEVDSDENG
jgi:hypothetical protein